MTNRPARFWMIIVVVLGLVGLVRLWSATSARDDAATAPAPPGESASRASTDVRDRADAPVGVSSGQVAVPSAPTPGPPLRMSRVRLRVQAPADTPVGHVFPVQIELEAEVGVRELLFTVVFDKSRLALTRWSEGDYAQQAGIPTELVAQEPSDGNVQVAFRVSNGLSIAGAGALIVLEFESTRAGTSGITLRDISAFGTDGKPEPDVAILATGAVNIH